jgi:hypothetical protein
MKNILFKSIIVLIYIFIISSCNDKPSDMAINLLPDTVKIKSISTYDTTLITGTRVYRARYPIFNLGSVFIGKAQGLSAVTLLNFAYLPDTLGTLTEDKIESVKLTMYPERYTMGDSLQGTLEFNIYQVIRRWNPDTTSYDSLIVSPANYFGTEKLYTFNGRITLQDTINPIAIELPKKLITEWLKTEMVYDTTTKTTVPKRIVNWGIALVPSQNSTVINRFSGNMSSGNTSSKIFVNYRDNKDSLNVLQLVSGVDMSFIDAPKPDTNDIVIQNGVNYWTEIFFDLSMIPKFAGIHKSQFELFLNPAKSYHGNVPLDSIIEGDYFYRSDASPTFQYLAYKEPSTNRYVYPSFTSAIQYWNRSTGKGSIVLLPNSPSNQGRELERLVFYGVNSSEKDKRPILRVIYSVNPANYGVK